MTLKFVCKQLSINDEELGCTLSLSDSDEIEMQKTSDLSLKEIEASLGHYVLLQRSYPEDDDEDDYYYIESSNDEMNGEFEDFSIHLSRAIFLLNTGNHCIEVLLSLNNKEFDELKKALKTIVNGKGELIIND